MRILQYSFYSFLFMALSVFVLFIIAQEILIFWGSSKVQSALYDLPTVELSDVCQEYLNQYSEDRISVAYQLRFLSDTEFISEATCQPFNSNATELERYTLPPFVSKIPGSSGVIWGDVRSGLGLTVFKNVYDFFQSHLKINLGLLQKEKYIFAEKEVITTSSVADTYGELPIAACEGYGYQCCDSIAEEGVGSQLLNTTNCERTCFSSCVGRPEVLSFMSDPYPDLNTREVVILPNSQVIFQYLVDPKDPGTSSIVLNFGDGTEETLTDINGTAQHLYTCSTVSCIYDATLTITNTSGRKSVMTPISNLRILVQNN